VPFRLLGLVADPNRVGDLCGIAGAYAASGTSVTIATPLAAPSDEPRVRANAQARGIHDLVPLQPDDPPTLRNLAFLVELMESRRPQVVVVDGETSAWQETAAGAFSLARKRLAGIGDGPAKLYFRAAPPIKPGITTAIIRGHSSKPELFIRAYPRPWVTGVLEDDLFLGLKAERCPTLTELLAS
jgi:hypothetical protein